VCHTFEHSRILQCIYNYLTKRNPVPLYAMTMKKLLLSAALFLSVCTLSFAQRKMQFGVTAQIGSYLQPQQAHEATDYLVTDYQLNAGALTGVGLYAERALCNWVALRSTLNFSQSIYKEQLMLVYPDAEKAAIGSGTYKQTSKFTVRQVALPIQMQFRAGASRHISFSVGVAPSFTLTKIRSTPDEPYPFNPYGGFCGDGLYYNDAFDLEKPAIKFQMLATAGLHYQFDTQNALGLELWVAPNGKEDLDYYTYGYRYYQSLYAKSYQMRSLQLSLRHSW